MDPCKTFAFLLTISHYCYWVDARILGFEVCKFEPQQLYFMLIVCLSL